MKFWTDLGFLLSRYSIHKNQLQWKRSLFNQAFPLLTKASGFLLPETINAVWNSPCHIWLDIRSPPHWGSLRLWHKGTLRALGVSPLVAPSYRAALYGCAEWKQGYHSSHSQRVTAAHTLCNVLWKECISNVKSWVRPSLTERAALERLRFAFLERWSKAYFNVSPCVLIIDIWRRNWEYIYGKHLWWKESQSGKYKDRMWFFISSCYILYFLYDDDDYCRVQITLVIIIISPFRNHFAAYISIHSPESNRLHPNPGFVT